uniref:Uncharacterized protein n=1 Tax=Ralstonia solanacearum TaxID=305 RepID=A0A0S4TVW1_RALSL|nr:protein of unknown function [Ralstonia solanacearum]
MAGAQMAQAGFPPEEVLDIIERARPHTQAVADDLVSMVGASSTNTRKANCRHRKTCPGWLT